MSTPQPTSTPQLCQEIDQQTRHVESLRLSVYSQTDPSDNPDLFAQLAAAEEKLAQLETQLAESRKTEQTEDQPTRSAPKGRFLGERTTELSVDAKLQLDPIPTGAYHLMDPETDPLLVVDVSNSSREIRRVCVTAYLEGLSAQAVRTIEIEPRQTASFRLHPTLFPERVQAIREVQRATLHVIVADLDGKIECHDTYHVTCLARTSSFNAVRRPGTGEHVDLSHYYGAWVTPHVESVQDRIRRAVELTPQSQLLGYQGDPKLIDEQVAALYQSLREAEILYVNSVIDYGATAGMVTQRTRLPRESLAMRSANCIDGTVLMASLIEGISLNPAIVLVPGHAFVAWETWYGSQKWHFLETTMIGSADFAAACQSAQRQSDQLRKFSPQKLKIHSVSDLRRRGIWPME